MTTETTVSPGEETQNHAPEATATETPEVAAPENDEAAERDEPAKVLKRMERRIEQRAEPEPLRQMRMPFGDRLQRLMFERRDLYWPQSHYRRCNNDTAQP